MKTIRAARLLSLLTLKETSCNPVGLWLVPGKAWSLFAWFSLALLVGCAAAPPRPAIVSDGKIKNPSIGFKGYEVTIPTGYQVFTPGTTNAEDTPFIAGIKKDYGTNYSQIISGRYDFMESFLLTSHESAILFVARTHTIRFAFSQIPERHRQEFLQNVAIFTPERQIGPAAKNIIKLGDRYILKTTLQDQLARSDPSKTLFQADIYLVLGNLNEDFHIGSFAPKEKAAAMIPVLDQMVGNLKL
jgi:hypothetical protein